MAERKEEEGEEEGGGRERDADTSMSLPNTLSTARRSEAERKRSSSSSSNAGTRTTVNDAMSGVAYMSYIPPALRANKLRSMLSVYADIGRIYLSPAGSNKNNSITKSNNTDDDNVKDNRKKKSESKRYHEGWIEFKSKKACRRVCALLNGEQMRGKRRSKHYHDLWCIKYVKKLTWDMMNEDRVMRRVHKEHRIREEVSRARADRDFYLSRVDQAKAIEAMEQRKKRKRNEQPQDESNGNGNDDDNDDDIDNVESKAMTRIKTKGQLNDGNKRGVGGDVKQDQQKRDKQQDKLNDAISIPKNNRVKREFKQRTMKSKQSTELDDDFISKLL